MSNITPSPMSQYNKSNPLVILSKKEYDSIIEKNQLISKNFLIICILLILTGTIFLISASVDIFIFDHRSLYRVFGIILSLIFFVCSDTGIIFHTLRRLKYFTHTHPGMLEFNEISSKEMNEILMIGPEDLLQCLHNMYTLEGEINSTSNYLKFLGYAIVSIQIAINFAIVIEGFLSS